MKMEVVNTENLKKEIEAEVKPVDKEVEQINKQAQENTNEIMALDLENVAEKRQMLKSIDEFAMETMENSSRKNSLLQTTIGNLSKEGSLHPPRVIGRNLGRKMGRSLNLLKESLASSAMDMDMSRKNVLII